MENEQEEIHDVFTRYEKPVKRKRGRIFRKRNLLGLG